MSAQNAAKDRSRSADRGRQPDRLWRELVGQVLRSERVEHGWTLQEISGRSGVSPQYLSEVERGRKDPSSEMLDSICGALGLRLADLLTASSDALRIDSSHLRLARPAQDSPAGQLGRRPHQQQPGVTLLAA